VQALRLVRYRPVEREPPAPLLALPLDVRPVVGAPGEPHQRQRARGAAPRPKTTPASRAATAGRHALNDSQEEPAPPRRPAAYPFRLKDCLTPRVRWQACVDRLLCERIACRTGRVQPAPTAGAWWRRSRRYRLVLCAARRRATAAGARLAWVTGQARRVPAAPRLGRRAGPGLAPLSSAAWVARRRALLKFPEICRYWQEPTDGHGKQTRFPVAGRPLEGLQRLRWVSAG
jgi:hypothetical protein